MHMYMYSELLQSLTHNVKRKADVDTEDYTSLRYFRRVLRNLSIIGKLEKMGIEEGGTVNTFGFEFDFVF